jgi:hypothetical protein
MTRTQRRRSLLKTWTWSKCRCYYLLVASRGEYCMYDSATVTFDSSFQAFRLRS